MSTRTHGGASAAARILLGATLVLVLPGGCRVDPTDVRSVCGNGVVEEGEECDDGNPFDFDSCTVDCLIHDQCGDGYCDPSLETCRSCPDDCCPRCGNGRLDPGEECDDGNTAAGDGCTADCLDEDGQATCGNGLWEEGEECDDGDTEAGDGCSDLCLLEPFCGDARCDPDLGETCEGCAFDCCPSCGNGVLETLLEEQCDTDDLGGLSCPDLCFDGGTLGCTAGCALDASQCTGTGPSCGDGVAECGEQCDREDLRGATCLSLGSADGTLICAGDCSYDQSECSD